GIFFWLLLLLVFASTVYNLICLYSGWMFFRDKPTKKDSSFTPPLTILKPVRGVDDRAYDCFVSFCQQDYPEFELIFGVRDADDPAIELIERLKKEFPERPIRLVVNPTRIGISAKVSNLHNILPQAKHELLVISDSDILVERDYLKR